MLSPTQFILFKVFLKGVIYKAYKCIAYLVISNSMLCLYSVFNVIFEVYYFNLEMEQGQALEAQLKLRLTVGWHVII